MTGDKPKVETAGDDAGASASDLQIPIEIEDDDSADDGSVEVTDADVEAGEAAEPAEPAEELAASAAEADESAAKIAQLEANIEELQTKSKATHERLLRTTADYDNFRKRSKRDQEDARTDAKTKVLREMLPVIDNLERAVEHSGGAAGNGAAGILDGVRLVLRQFAGALEKCDVVGLDALGEPFDPNVHEAIGQMATTDYPVGACAQVLQRGYKIGKRLLRPSLVIVAKAPDPEPEAEPKAEAEAEESEQEAAAEAGEVTEAAAASDDAAGDDASTDAEAKPEADADAEDAEAKD